MDVDLSFFEDDISVSALLQFVVRSGCSPSPSSFAALPGSPVSSALAISCVYLARLLSQISRIRLLCLFSLTNFLLLLIMFG